MVAMRDPQHRRRGRAAAKSARSATAQKRASTVAVAGQTLTVAVKVQLAANEPPTSFRHEVMPILTRAGCNAGACHGYSLGKNGFKLSLRGSDPSWTISVIVKESLGRRINLLVPRQVCSWPGRGDVPHEGGTRFQAREPVGSDLPQPGFATRSPADLDRSGSRRRRPAGCPTSWCWSPDRGVQMPRDNTTTAPSRDVTRLGIFVANNDRYVEGR